MTRYCQDDGQSEHTSAYNMIRYTKAYRIARRCGTSETPRKSEDQGNQTAYTPILTGRCRNGLAVWFALGIPLERAIDSERFRRKGLTKYFRVTKKKK